MVDGIVLGVDGEIIIVSFGSLYMFRVLTTE